METRSCFPFCIKTLAGEFIPSKSKSLDTMKLQSFLFLSFIIHSYSSADVIVYKEDLNASMDYSQVHYVAFLFFKFF